MTNVPVHDQKNKHLKELLLLFSVPVGIVFVIVAFLYVPRMLANPSYDFIYCTGHTCDNQYTVSSSGEINTPEGSIGRYSYDPSSLRYFDIEDDASRPITIDDAKNYRLSAKSKSPDGYTLERHTQSGGLFSFNYEESWSLKKGLLSKPVTLSSNQHAYSSNTSFVGWVISNE